VEFLLSARLSTAIAVVFAEVMRHSSARVGDTD
jgi:hypothetical protein